jgi:hypothetical protein
MEGTLTTRNGLLYKYRKRVALAQALWAHSLALVT